jgi:LPXTG-motif cell wall-anchored protein
MYHSTNIWRVIAKRIAPTGALALALMLTALLVAAASAYAQPQGSVTATGVLVGPVEDGDLDPTPKYKMADEETGTNYVLVSGFVELAPFVGQRVTIAGEPIGGADWAPPALNVTQIEPADGGDDNDPPAVNDKATLAFELTVDGDPPADAAFYGNVRTGEGGPGLYVPLTDPDKDRVYTGSTTVDRFGPGPRPVPEGTEPVSLPVQIVHDSEVIKDFGTVKLDGDKTFEASVSFPVDDCPIISPTPEQCGDDSGGSDDGDGSGGGDPNSGGSGGSGSGSSGSSGSSNGESSGSGGSSSGGVAGDIANGLRGVLPSTGGGMALWALGAGLLLIAGGLLVRKVFR